MENWIKVNAEVTKNFIGWAWVLLRNPLTGQEDIEPRFICKKRDYLFITHIIPLDKPKSPNIQPQ